MKTTYTSSSHCPGCGAVRDATTSLEENARPEEGDLSICMYCATVFQFGKGLEQIPMALTEIAKLPGSARRDLERTVARIYAFWRSRGHADGKGRAAVVWEKE